MADCYSRCGTTDIIINEVEFSLNYLLDCYEQLKGQMPLGKCIAGVSQQANSVKLCVSNSSIHSYDTDLINFIIEVSSTHPCISVETGDTLQQNCSTVKVGSRFWGNSQNFSGGYWAKYNNVCGYYMVTTAHQFYNTTSGVDVYNAGESSPWGVEANQNEYIGTYIDAALITRYNATQTPVHSTLTNGITVSGTRSSLPENSNVSVLFNGTTTNNVTILNETQSYWNSAAGISQTLYYMDFSCTGTGESGSPVYYKYNNKYYLFGIIVGGGNRIGSYICKASTINAFYGISAYTG